MSRPRFVVAVSVAGGEAGRRGASPARGCVAGPQDLGCAVAGFVKGPRAGATWAGATQMKRLSGGWRWFDDLGRDLRHALRGLRRSPGFAVAVILILALGIGAATAMFSIVYGVLLRPLPYPDPGAIVRVGRITRSFAPLRPAGTPVPSDPDEMVRTGLQIVGPGYLDAMRFRLRAGRTLTPLDGREGPRVLVANETLARGLFGGGPAVGRQVIVGYGEPWEVVGVVGDVVYGGLDLTAAREAEAFIPLSQGTEMSSAMAPAPASRQETGR